MSHFSYKPFYRRDRPHIHPPDSVFFVTFRLAGSIPKAVVDRYKSEKKWLENDLIRLAQKPTINPGTADRLAEFHRNWFARFEQVMDQARCGPMWLGEQLIRNVVAEKLLAGDGDDYRLDAYSIMSNHVHVVLKPKLSERNLIETRIDDRLGFASPEKTFTRIMQGIKGSTAREANLCLGRSGSFWEKESFDHYIRDEAEFHRIVKYTLNNPVKAGLISHWSEWPGNFLAARLRELYP